jgi:flavin reductase (DIM6/NTAB) family NADH-FMN oxidoreductase RutF
VISSFDSLKFRHVLGHYPTGVCVITTIHDGEPVGMTVGSFTSVSLTPPLIAFFPDRKSSSWQKIAAAGRFCVNVLGHHQQAVCAALASRSDNKFGAISYRMSDSDLPVIDDGVAWIDCDLHAVHEAGDHYIAIGQVHSLDVGDPHDPLLFLRGGYGKFASIGPV